MKMKKQKVLGYDINLQSFGDVVIDTVDSMKDCKGLHIVTINPEMIELANSNSEFFKVLNRADLLVPDGFGIVLALKFKGIIQEQIRGIELAKELIEECSNCGFPVGFIGAREKVIQKTISRLKAEYKLLNVVYSRNGYFNQDQEEEIIKDIQRANPRFLLVALGAPKQELFIAKCKKIMPNTVFIGVGGSFDVWAGEVERAPQFYQNIGMEWLYRTIKQPERFKRIYKTIPLFLIKSFIDGIKYRLNKRAKNG